MSTKVALEHRTTYRFDRSIMLGPHVIRLRPAPHTRTPVDAYSLTISPADHVRHWQQDPFGNHLARVVFPTPADTLDVTVGLVVDLRTINPFDFFVEPYAERYPFRYEDELARDLQPYLGRPDTTTSPTLARWLERVGTALPTGRPTIEALVALNTAVRGDVAYSLRMEEGVQTPEETLTRALGSCRDSAWLLVTALRHLGLAARFVSGYLVQLAADVPGSGGPAEDFTDLHAWTEVYLPGAGWIGLDPTSALFASEGHIPLAATPNPSSAAAITGMTERSRTTLAFSNTVRRVHEDPRPTRPYRPEQRAHLDRLGEHVDERLAAAGLELTTAGRPTFVATTDGLDERRRADALAVRLAEQRTPGALLRRRHGPRSPEEDRPRADTTVVWRTDGVPLWEDPALLADPYAASAAVVDAPARARTLALRLATAAGLPPGQTQPCWEDPLAALAEEVRRPAGPRPAIDPRTADPALLTTLDAGEPAPVAWALPLVPTGSGDAWASPAWATRRGRVVLVPGDEPAGSRLPLEALSWADPDQPGAAPTGASDRPPADAAGGLRAVVADPQEMPDRTALVVEAREGRVHVFLPALEQVDRFVELVRFVERGAASVSTPVVLEGHGPPPDPRIGTLTVSTDRGVVAVELPPAARWSELAELTATVHRLAGEQGLGTATSVLDGGHHLTLGGPAPDRSPLLRRPDLLVSLVTYWQHHPALSYLFADHVVGADGPAPRADEGGLDATYELETALAEVAALLPDERRPETVDRLLRRRLSDSTGDPRRSEFGLEQLWGAGPVRHRQGRVVLRGFGMPPHPDLALLQALLVRALLVRLAEDAYDQPLVRWGPALHERFLLPHFALADAAEVVADLQAHGLDVDTGWLTPYLELRFPLVGVTTVGAADRSEVRLELRQAVEPAVGRGASASGDGSVGTPGSRAERVQVLVSGFVPERQVLTCNGRPVPLAPTGTPGRHVAGIRYRAGDPGSRVDAPLHLDVVDRASRVSLGGATCSAVDPGGRSSTQPPVDAAEAEARRASRFQVAHTPGEVDVAALDAELGWRASTPQDQPLTLDLRRRPPSVRGRRR